MTFDMSAARTGSEPGEPRNAHPEAKGHKQGSTRPHDGEGIFSTIRHRADGAKAQPPTAISDAQKGRLFHARNVLGDAQRLAKAHLGDPHFSWRKFGQLVANCILLLAPGRYVYPDAKRPVSWPVACPATALCFGKHRIFETLDEVPEWLAGEVAAGMRLALELGAHVAYTSEDCGRKLGATAAEIMTLELWRLAPIDKTPGEWTEMKAERQRRRRLERDRAKGVRSRAEYLAGSVAQEARRLGIKADTLQKRRRRAGLADVRSPVDRRSISIAKDVTPDTRHGSSAGEEQVRTSRVPSVSPRLFGARPKARNAEFKIVTGLPPHLVLLGERLRTAASVYPASWRGQKWPPTGHSPSNAPEAPACT